MNEEGFESMFSQKLCGSLKYFVLEVVNQVHEKMLGGGEEYCSLG